MNKLKSPFGMRTARAVLTLVAAGGCMAAGAREARTSMGVSATVLAVARLELTSAPTEVQVSAADLRRGFIDVTEPTAFVVRGNTPAGFALDITTVDPIISGVVVHGLESEHSLGAAGGTLIQHWLEPHTAALSLTFRLVLAPGMAAGHYPWPMRLSVRPLDTA